jgi:hypothetical protein
MKKIIIALVMLGASVGAKAQFSNTDTLKRFINRWIRNSAVEAFQNLRLNTALIGMTNFLDSAYGGQVKNFEAVNDTTVRLVTIADDTLSILVRGNGITGLRRRSGTDSVEYLKNGSGWTFAYKDSTGGGGSATLTNSGTGYRFATTPNGTVKSLVAGDGLRGDSTANAGSITFYRDTTGSNGSVTRSELKDTTASLRRKISDTLIYAIQSILIPSRLEFIASADTATYQNDDLIGTQIMMLSIESYQVGFTVRSTSVYMSFDSATGTITLSNGEFAEDDQVIIIYRTPPVFLLDGSGNPVRDGSGNFIILN